MALYKEIEQSNGVITTYHRIVSMNVITNVQNTIEIASYTSQEKRQEEINAMEHGIGCNVYISTSFKNAEYNQDMTIKSTYDWLKTLPDFEGVEDV